MGIIMASITGILDLSQIPQDQFDPKFELRVAVVRNATVLGSATLSPTADARQILFEVTFEPPILAPARSPCPVVLLVGPNVGDQELQSLETLHHQVDLRATAPVSAIGSGAIDVGRLQVSAALYGRWLGICRTYTVRGRVVCRQWQYDAVTGRWGFCDAPVPGAKVEAYDVDCFLWWCWRALITSAVT